MALLKVDSISVKYGNIPAVRDVSFEVEECEIITLLGANGAGKSTIMRSIMGLEPLCGGSIIYDGRQIDRQSTGKRVASGITLVPEGRRIFPRFSVDDNLLMGGYLTKPSRRRENRRRVFSLFPKLEERHDQIAGTLSGGEQQMLAIGRAMMAEPRMLLLDEPSLGLAPLLVRDILGMVRQIRELGTTVLLVEQNARSALRISDRAYVLETGKIVLQGNSSDLMNSERVRKAYLGGK